MKTKIITFVLSLLISASTVCQNVCGTYYPFKEGVKFQITNFDKKGKKASVVDYQVLDIKNNVASISSKISDDKDKEITTTIFEVTCNSDGITIDFKSLMNPELFKQYKDMEIEMTGTNIDFPNKLKVGQKLADAKLNMTMNMGIKMTMYIEMVNRTVNAQESITTAAGTFNCFALSYDTEMKMGIKQTYKIKEWIAEGVGAVKSETYNNSGKLMAFSELTSITK